MENKRKREEKKEKQRSGELIRSKSVSATDKHDVLSDNSSNTSVDESAVDESDPASKDSGADVSGPTVDESQSEKINTAEVKKRPRMSKHNVSVPANIPLDIVKKTAGEAERHGISIAAHTALVASFVNASNADINQIPLNSKSTWRERKAYVKEDFMMIQHEFKEQLRTSHLRLVLHFDGKMIEDNVGETFQTADHLAVLLSSPDLASGQPQLLGIPALDSGTGAQMCTTIMELVEQWEATDFIIGICYDTTASNTGYKSGSVVLIERFLQRSLLKFPCRRHTHELHAKHTALAISGRATTSPGDTLFKVFANHYNELKDNIDLENLVKFDWNKWRGTFMEWRAQEVLTWANHAVCVEVFCRGDYKELLELIVVWLGEAVSGFKIRKPKSVSSARFMQRGIYYLSMELLSRQYDLFEEEEKVEISLVAEFVGLFYGEWFLRSYLAASAPFADLTAISQIRKYKEIRPAAAQACLQSWSRHLDYLSPPLVIFALTDPDVPDAERKAVASALLATDKPEEFPPVRITVPGPDFTESNEYWAEDGSMPSLARFVDSTSWMIFHILGMKEEEVAWLNMDVVKWVESQHYNKFAEFVRGLMVVNDPSERSVQLAKQFVMRSRSEDFLQENYVSVTEHRKKFVSDKSGKMSKSVLKTLGGSKAAEK